MSDILPRSASLNQDKEESLIETGIEMNTDNDVKEEQISFLQKLTKYSLFSIVCGMFVHGSILASHPVTVIFTLIVLVGVCGILGTNIMKLGTVYSCCSTFLITHGDPILENYDIVVPTGVESFNDNNGFLLPEWEQT